MHYRNDRVVNFLLIKLLGIKGELQSLELLSDIVRKELKRRTGWLLIVDNLNGANSLTTVPVMGGTNTFEGGMGSVTPPALPIQQNALISGWSDLLVCS